MPSFHESEWSPFGVRPVQAPAVGRGGVRRVGVRIRRADPVAEVDDDAGVLDRRRAPSRRSHRVSRRVATVAPRSSAAVAAASARRCRPGSSFSPTGPTMIATFGGSAPRAGAARPRLASSVASAMTKTRTGRTGVPQGHEGCYGSSVRAAWHPGRRRGKHGRRSRVAGAGRLERVVVASAGSGGGPAAGPRR